MSQLALVAAVACLSAGYLYPDRDAIAWVIAIVALCAAHTFVNRRFTVSQ